MVARLHRAIKRLFAAETFFFIATQFEHAYKMLSEEVFRAEGPLRSAGCRKACRRYKKLPAGGFRRAAFSVFYSPG